MNEKDKAILNQIGGLLQQAYGLACDLSEDAAKELDAETADFAFEFGFAQGMDALGNVALELRDEAADPAKA